MNETKHESDSINTLLDEKQLDALKFVCKPDGFSLSWKIVFAILLVGCGIFLLLMTQYDKKDPPNKLLFDHLFSWITISVGLYFLIFSVRKIKSSGTGPLERSVVLHVDKLVVYNHSIWSDIITVPYESITEIRKERFFGNWNIAIKYLHRSLIIELAESNIKSVVDELFEELFKRVPEKTKKIDLGLKEWQFTLGQLFWITTLLAAWLSLRKININPFVEFFPWMILTGITVYFILWKHYMVIPKSRSLRAFLIGLCGGILVECAGSLAWCAAIQWSASWASTLATLPYPLSMGLLEQIYNSPTGAVDLGYFLLPTLFGAYLASGVVFGIIAFIIYLMCTCCVDSTED